MRSSRGRTHGPPGPCLRRLLGATICLGFLLQQVVLPVHLILEHHVHPRTEESEPARVETAAPTVAAHGHAHPHGHGHAHGHSQENAHARATPDPRHAAPAADHGHDHPARDHLDTLAGPPLPKRPFELVLALVSTVPDLPFLDSPSSQRAPESASEPRPPPPRQSPEPRAPPVVA